MINFRVNKNTRLVDFCRQLKWMGLRLKWDCADRRLIVVKDSGN